MGIFSRDKEEQDQPQLVGNGTPYYQPTIMSSEKADLFDKIKPEEVVNAIKFQLMGYWFNYSTQVWEPNKAMMKTALTELGATKIATFMLPVSSKSVTITKLNADEIRERIKGLMREVMKACLREWKDYGMITSAHFVLVKSVVLSNTLITLKQPENAGVRQFIQGTTSEQRLIQEQPKQSGGILGVFRR
jgi:hypothetical protein